MDEDVISVDSDEAESSDDSVCVDEILELVRPEEDPNYLHYLCRTTDGAEDVFDRSDLMDGGQQQKLVLAFERRCPPPWDEVCLYCDGEGCEECICETCERPCRHIGGVNYGCVKHPVV